jgi:hypothetical protein
MRMYVDYDNLGEDDKRSIRAWLIRHVITLQNECAKDMMYEDINQRIMAGIMLNHIDSIHERLDWIKLEFD